MSVYLDLTDIFNVESEYLYIIRRHSGKRNKHSGTKRNNHSGTKRSYQATKPQKGTRPRHHHQQINNKPP